MRTDEQSRFHFDSKAALYAGLLAAIVFWVFSRGIPWNSIGIPDRVMGRVIFPSSMEYFFIWTAGLQLAVSIIYAFIVSGLTYRIRTIPSVYLGMAIGAALYGLNYLVFHHILSSPGLSVNEFIPFLIHVFLGAIVAAAYKGFSAPVRRRA